MRVRVVPLALCVLTAACGATSTSPSALQRYQALRAGLAATTLADIRLAGDSARLGRMLAALQIGRVPAQDAALKRDALRLQDEAGRSAAGIRPLLRAEADRHVRAYFQQVMTALSDQWAEAGELIHVADTLWWDPWLASPTDARMLEAFDGAARRDASKAVQATEAAAAIRRHYRRVFQYVVVKSNAGHSQAADAPRGSDG